MLKLIGAVIIIAAGTLLGFYQSFQLARRPRQIRQLIQALQRLETEVLYGFTPLPEALLSAAKPLPPPISAMLAKAAGLLSDPGGRSTAECWQKAVAEHWTHTAMKAGEQDVVLQLGFTLGVTDREDQIKHLRLTVDHLQAEAETAQEEKKRYAGMWKSLGVLSGALIVILMY